MISFGASDDEMEDSLSLAASDAEVLSGSVSDPALLPSSASRNARLRVDEELMTKAVNKLGLEWSPPVEPSRSRLDEWFLPGPHQALGQRSSPFFPEVHDELTKSWHAPYSTCIRPSASTASHQLTVLKRKDTSTCLLWMSPWPQISALPWLSDGRQGWAIRPSRAEPHLHSLDVPTWRLDKRLRRYTLWLCSRSSRPSEEAGLDATSLGDLRSTTDLDLHARHQSHRHPRDIQAIGLSMSSLIVLERHLWLTMMEIKEVDKVPILDAPVSSGSLFEPAVEGFAERLTEGQKSSQAMRHFLPKRTSSSAASSRPRPAPTQQKAKPMPATPEPLLPEGRRARGCSCSARRYPFPKCQGPQHKIVLDPAPQKSSSFLRKRSAPSLATAGPPASSL